MKDLARKGVVVFILAIVAYVLLRAVVGMVIGVLWTVLIVLCLAAAIWALNRLL